MTEPRLPPTRPAAPPAASASHDTPPASRHAATTQPSIRRRWLAPDTAPPLPAMARLAIDTLQPDAGGGRHPHLAVVGEGLEVSAEIPAPPGAVVRAELVYKLPGETTWRRARMRPPEDADDGRWRAALQLVHGGRLQYTVEAWIDVFETWLEGVRRAGVGGSVPAATLQRGRELVAEAAKRVRGGADAMVFARAAKQLAPALQAWVQEGDAAAASPATGQARTSKGRPAAKLAARTRRLAASELEELRKRMRVYGARAAWTRLEPPVPAFVARRRARVGGWVAPFGLYALPAAPPAALEPDAIAAPLATYRRAGFDVLLLPAPGASEEAATPGSAARSWCEAAQAAGFEVAWALDAARALPACTPGSAPFTSPGTLAEMGRVWEAWVSVASARGVRMLHVVHADHAPLVFWEAACRALRREHPEIVLSAESSGHADMDRGLARAGFVQLTVMAGAPGARRVHVPAWLGFGPERLACAQVAVESSAPAAELVLAALRAPAWSLRGWNPDHASRVGKLQRIRRDSAAAQWGGLPIALVTSNPALEAFARCAPGGRDLLLVVVNHDETATQEGWVETPTDLGLPLHDAFSVHDVLHDTTYTWHGTRHPVRLEPQQIAHVLRFRRSRRLA